MEPRVRDDEVGEMREFRIVDAAIRDEREPNK